VPGQATAVPPAPRKIERRQNERPDNRRQQQITVNNKQSESGDCRQSKQAAKRPKKRDAPTIAHNAAVERPRAAACSAQQVQNEVTRLLRARDAA
jgi:hypothetical protein